MWDNNIQSQTMKAVIFNEYGGNQVIQVADVQKPKLETPYDIIVHVQAVATNPIDWKVREGALVTVFFKFNFKKNSEKPERRVILGWDASGVVEQVGTSVANFKVGDKVMFAGTVNRDGKVLTIFFFLLTKALLLNMP